MEYHLSSKGVETMPEYDIGKKIKELRFKRNMTQKDLAKAFNVASSTISNWETGTRLPSLHELRRLADYFNVSLNIFDQGDQEKNDDFRVSALEDRQIIDFKPLGLPFSSLNHIIFLFSVIMLMAASLIPYLIAFAFLIIGLISLVFVFANIMIETDKRKRTSYKRLQIPAHDVVMYQHKLEDQDILRLQKKASLLSVFHLIVGVGFNGLLLFVLSSYGSDLLTAFVSLFVLTSLITSIFHYRHVHGHVIIRKKIAYHMAFYDLKYPILFLVLAMNTIALFGYALFWSLRPLENPGWLAATTSLMGMLTVLVSYLIYVYYHAFIRGYRLIRISKDGIENTVA
jgi:transcriptional regulator with XRE-family HTH domain